MKLTILLLKPPRHTTDSFYARYSPAISLPGAKHQVPTAQYTVGPRAGTEERPKQTNSMVWVRERTIPTERPPLVGEVIANFCE
jgi:hypothetical protein